MPERQSDRSPAAAAYIAMWDELKATVAARDHVKCMKLIDRYSALSNEFFQEVCSQWADSANSSVTAR